MTCDSLDPDLPQRLMEASSPSRSAFFLLGAVYFVRHFLLIFHMSLSLHSLLLCLSSLWCHTLARTARARTVGHQSENRLSRCPFARCTFLFEPQRRRVRVRMRSRHLLGHFRLRSVSSSWYLLALWSSLRVVSTLVWLAPCVHVCFTSLCCSLDLCFPTSVVVDPLVAMSLFNDVLIEVISFVVLQSDVEVLEHHFHERWRSSSFIVHMITKDMDEDIMTISHSFSFWVI